MSSGNLLGEVIEAHGGRDRWQAVERIDASLSSGGLAFASRFQPFALRNLKISVDPHEPRVILRDFCQTGWSGEWTPRLVQIRDEKESLVNERHNPRAALQGFAKVFCWDRLDILYFAGYALWNYLSFPFLLELPGVNASEADGAGGERCLNADFAPDFPTHSVRQTFHLDASRRLVRHDYTADLMSQFATAANFCTASEEVAGMRFYTRRKVTPRFGQRLVMPFPTLVWIEIDKLQVRFKTELHPGSMP